MTTEPTTIRDYGNGLFLYTIYRGHVIIEDIILGQRTSYMIYDTGSVEVAAKLHDQFDYCEFDECSFAGAMQRVDKWV